MKKNYTELRAQLVHYVSDQEHLGLPTIVDGVLERLAVAGIVEPDLIEGWPSDGLIAPLIEDSEEASSA